MSYTTEELKAIENVKYEAKVELIDILNDARQDYEDATQSARDEYNTAAAEARRQSKEIIRTRIATEIEDMRTVVD